MTTPKLIGSLGDCTVVILTGPESRVLRELLEDVEACGDARGIRFLNAGIARGTARLQQEFKDEQARKRREGK